MWCENCLRVVMVMHCLWVGGGVRYQVHIRYILLLCHFIKMKSFNRNVKVSALWKVQLCNLLLDSHPMSATVGVTLEDKIIIYQVMPEDCRSKLDYWVHNSVSVKHAPTAPPARQAVKLKLQNDPLCSTPLFFLFYPSDHVGPECLPKVLNL